MSYDPIQAHGPVYGDHTDDLRSFHQRHAVSTRLTGQELSKHPDAIVWHEHAISDKLQQHRVPHYLLNRNHVVDHHLDQYHVQDCNQALHKHYTNGSSVRFMGRESYVPQRRQHFSNIRDL